MKTSTNFYIFAGLIVLWLITRQAKAAVTGKKGPLDDLTNLIGGHDWAPWISNVASPDDLLNELKKLNQHNADQDYQARWQAEQARLKSLDDAYFANQRA